MEKYEKPSMEVIEMLNNNIVTDSNCPLHVSQGQGNVFCSPVNPCSGVCADR